MSDEELDVRTLRKPEKHPAIFRTFEALDVGASFVLLNNHDPRHLRDEFETDYPGGYGWEYLTSGPDLWRIRISKLASTPLPRALGNTDTVAADSGGDVTGAIWKLHMRQRDLDSNIIQLPAGASIDAHAGPDLDVLLVVLHGAGQLTTEGGSIDLRPGEIIWLPKRSRREFVAGPDGLRYLTVHQRRRSLVIGMAAQ